MPKVDRMFAFLAEEEDGEGLVAMESRSAGWIPLVGADMERVLHLKPYAEEIAKATGQTIKLVEFTTRVDMEVIEP